MWPSQPNLNMPISLVHLFVGGPMDGQHVAVPETLTRVAASAVWCDGDANPFPEKHAHYLRTTILCAGPSEGGRPPRIDLFIAEGTTAYAALTMLVERYPKR